ncbi:hypothetical protein P5673_023815 [Acropora cervicornis]|uniref:Uncharacterized protein n=1 Tax=Acropora cervicornis TaxID=6130 RepID=A0AAD9Q4W2_ACRCE|nr:hypothetical protein P5673_023815 [Acropora cervicornis]
MCTLKDTHSNLKENVTGYCSSMDSVTVVSCSTKILRLPSPTLELLLPNPGVMSNRLLCSRDNWFLPDSNKETGDKDSSSSVKDPFSSPFGSDAFGSTWKANTSKISVSINFRKGAVLAHLPFNDELWVRFRTRHHVWHEKQNKNKPQTFEVMFMGINGFGPFSF